MRETHPDDRGSFPENMINDRRAYYEVAPLDDGAHLGGINLGAIWSAVYRMRFWMLSIIGAFLLLGVIVSMLSTPIYEAEASVQIEQEAAKVIGTEQTDSTTAVQDSDRFLKTQLDIIRSRTIAESVGESLDLFDNDKFLEAMGEDAIDDSDGMQVQKHRRREAVTKVLSDNLSVFMPVDSRIVSIRFTSPDSALAAKVANSFVDSYIRNNLKRKFDTSSYAREFLRGQLQEAETRLAASEEKALDYSRQRQIVDTGNPASTDNASKPRSLTTSMLVQLNSELANAYSRRLVAEKQWEIARGSALLELPDVQNNSSMQRLLQQKATAQAQMEEELQKRKEDYPSVRQLAAQIRELDRQMGIIGGGVRVAIKNQYEAALAEERALTARMEELKRETLDEQSEAVQLSILQRGTQTNRNLYDLLLNRYNELNAEAGVQSNNLAVVDRAEEPRDPVLPNIPLNLLLFLLAGVGVACGVVFMREQMFDTIRLPDDVVRKLSTVAIGVIPDAGDELSVRDEVENPKSQLAEAFASLRTSLMLASSHGLPRSIMFVSAAQGEGKSTICYGVAAALQKIGKSVVIIDLDLRRPRQHRIFEIANRSGMSEVLTGNRTLDEVIIKDEKTGISVVPAGEIPPSPVELLSSQLLKDVIAQLVERFDAVLVDSPPLLGLADAVIIGSVVEKCLFVVAAGKTPSQGVRRAVGRLRASGVALAGVVLSRFSAKEAGYGYGYGYGYNMYSYEHKDD